MTEMTIKKAIKEYDEVIAGYAANLIDNHYISEVQREFERQHQLFVMGRDALRAQLLEQENEPLTLDELREMELQQWVWIETKMPFDCKEKVTAYYSKHYDYTHDTAFCCGYPGITFSFDYADYGKTWLAYRRKPESVHNHET